MNTLYFFSSTSQALSSSLTVLFVTHAANLASTGLLYFFEKKQKLYCSSLDCRRGAAYCRAGAPGFHVEAVDRHVGQLIHRRRRHTCLHQPNQAYPGA